MTALEGKSIIITGAGRGLGAAYARLAAAEGARVVVDDVDAECTDRVAEEIRKAGGTAIASDADIGDWDSCGRLIDTCLKDFGCLDGLINNAGLFYMARPEEEDPARMEAIVRVNIMGTMFCGLHALRVMRAQGSGSIVNVTSGAQAGYAGMATYGATKGAVASLTYGWACDVAGTGVRVNAVSPIARTRMFDRMLKRGDPRRQRTGGGVQPEENGAIAVFLLSDAASDINGQIVRVDIPRLSIMTHPSEIRPAAEKESWSVADVRKAFAGELGKQLQPLGLGTNTR